MNEAQPIDEIRLKQKLRIEVSIVFETAWRIGSGREGQTSDLGVLVDRTGQPILPGSSIKGKLRSTCESLASAVGQSACMLNVEASGVPCASDVKWYSRRGPAGKESPNELRQDAAKKGVSEQLAWIEKYTCDVCKLFGSPVRAGRLRCSDGKLIEGATSYVQVRDGVVIDRDSHTAVDGLKYDYETVSAGTSFGFVVDLENQTPSDEAILGAALFEWASGTTLGGFTSRGLGRFCITDIKLWGVDFEIPSECLRYLVGLDPAKKLTGRGDWKTYFQERIELALGQSGTGGQ